MSSVFSLVTVGLALSMAVFLGASYLSPSFDIASIMASVAYDISAMYDIAYTLPGEVTIYYYGPGACKWNYNQPPNDASSFHCFSGEAVVINDVLFDKELIKVVNDPYMTYDYNIGASILTPQDVAYPRPIMYTINIPYYDAQICPYNTKLEACAVAQAPFASSYTDLTTLNADTPYEVKVEDYSFVVTKKNVGNYYNTVDDNPFTPDTLNRFLSLVASVYDLLCSEPSILYDESTGNNLIVPYNDGNTGAPMDSLKDLQDSEEEDHFLMMYRGRRWKVYDDSILCQERISYSEQNNNYTAACSSACLGEYNNSLDIYQSCWDEICSGYCSVNPESTECVECNNRCSSYIKRSEEECKNLCKSFYVIEYCFDIDSFVLRNNCDSINMVNMTQNFVDEVETNTYYASFSSCIKPYLWFNTTTGVLNIDVSGSEMNIFTGECENV